MTLKDVQEYATNGVLKDKFSRILKQDEPLIKELLSLGIKGYKKIEEYVSDYSFKERGNRNVYVLSSIWSSGDTIKQIRVYERNYEGYRFLIEYKGLSYVVYATLDGEIQTMSLSYWLFRGTNSHIDLDVNDCKTIDDVNKKSLDILFDNKRKVMNYYNREIKKLKKEYREDLDKINNIIKEASK